MVYIMLLKQIVFKFKSIFSMNINPDTGEDLDYRMIDRIDKLLNGNLKSVDQFEEAQLRELAFWRWVAFQGYEGKKPLEFFDHQKNFMTSCYKFTGWDINRYFNSRIFELGCGPLGMIEFIPSSKRYAFDPLNEYYSKLFKNLRIQGVEYLVNLAQIEALEKVDLGICFNVLDHTNDFKKWFYIFFNKIKTSGQFIIQVNTVKNEFERSHEHQKMHPSPITHKEIEFLISQNSSNFEYKLEDKPSVDYEFFFMAWGNKN